MTSFPNTLLVDEYTGTIVRNIVHERCEWMDLEGSADDDEQIAFRQILAIDGTRAPQRLAFDAPVGCGRLTVCIIWKNLPGSPSPKKTMSGCGTASISSAQVDPEYRCLTHLDKIVAYFTPHDLSLPNTLKHFLMRCLPSASQTMRFGETTMCLDNQVFW